MSPDVQGQVDVAQLARVGLQLGRQPDIRIPALQGPAGALT